VDIDVFGKYGSSELNGGGISGLFSQPINRRLAERSLDYFRTHARQLDFRQRGTLWLGMSDGPIGERLSVEDLRQRYPAIEDLSDLGAGALYTSIDGRLSPHRLRIHYLDHAQAGGVELMDRWIVTAIEGERSPWRVKLRQVTGRGVKKALVDGAASTGDDLTIEAQRIINAAGPWAARIARLSGYELPVTPVPRQNWLLRHPELNLEPLPVFMDTIQGIHVRHLDRDRKPCVMVGFEDPDTRAGSIDYTPKTEEFYRQTILPRVARRFPKLRDAEIVTTWVGHYELTSDKSAAIGAVPGREGMFVCAGLSGRGITLSRAIGEALADLLTRGRWPDDLNLDALTPSRFGSSGNIVSESVTV
jgi:sarcosine oxidase subunit beta